MTVASVAAVAGFLIVALLRVGHPYELQWMEGGSVDHVRRVLDGQSIYPAPSVEFASFTYPPLYIWVSAAVAWFSGVSFLPLRLVSLVASVATMLVLGLYVRHRTGRWVAGLVAAGVFAAAFRVTGAWYDVARVDSLFVLLLVSGVAVLGLRESQQGAVVAGLVFALAALTKQTAVIVAVPLAAYLLVRQPRRGVAFAGAFALPVVAVSIALNVASDGWYWYETVEVLAGHPVEGNAWLGYPARDIALHLGPALALVGAAWALARWRPAWTSGDGAPFTGVELVAVGAMFAGAYIARLHRGGYDDVLIPAFAGAALLTGLAVGHLEPRRALASTAVAGACLLQLALLVYDPTAQVPTSTDVAAGRALVATVREVPGDVLVVSHPWYTVMAGKPAHVQAAAYFDIVRSGDARARELVQGSVRRAIEEQRFAAVVFDTDSDERDLVDVLAAYYRKIDPPVLGPGQEGLWPVTDVQVRPTHWWVPRDDPANPAAR